MEPAGERRDDLVVGGALVIVEDWPQWSPPVSSGTIAAGLPLPGV